ncbi:hypothetical protein F5X99DRAFT_420139 [Biscogniauxia marginata]|nr:hypothetical protein F5X99DRAFT_420139 [Biscogniauxia marginata]
MTFSPASPVSRTSSVGSAWSSIHSDRASDITITTITTTAAAAAAATVVAAAPRSRGPSPLRNAVARAPGTELETGTETETEAKSEYLCRAPGCEARFSRRQDLEHHRATGHVHVCLWGDDGPCDSPGFASREELNWHVKSEHLLECPVSGCTEGVFASRDLLDCHVRWGHGIAKAFKTVGCQASNASETTTTTTTTTSAPLPATTPFPASNSKGDPPRAEEALAKMSDPTEESLKLEMSIGIAKKRCRDQLRAAVERKQKGASGTPKANDSPGAGSSRTPGSLESASFPMNWEHCVLPFLAEFLPRWCGPSHTVSVARGREPGTRQICIMAETEVPADQRTVIEGHVRDLLTETYRDAVTFVFYVGEIDRLVWARGLGKQMPDEVCLPRNPFAYVSPCMGDSIGLELEDEDEITATLGPCVTFGGESYWLANFHPFVDASRKTSHLTVEHPSPADRARCSNERHDVLSNDRHDFRVGDLVAKSGFNLSTTRVTHDPYWEDFGKERPLVVMDWALISTDTRQANLLRKSPSTTQRREVPVTSLSSVVPGATVCSTGRTSGFQKGQVCEMPAYVSGRANGTGKATREWYIEEPYSRDSEDDAWIRGGIGVPGDSGAAIVDGETNALVGQLWGRNRCFGPGPRITYFTPVSDIFDDIQEKCDQETRPQLPQYREEADRWPVYPICRQCFDLREYLDSRRSSRESLMSMIGMHDGKVGENDNDLTSVSELATPKDQSHLIRHIGPDETASPFSGVVSPAPIHTFYSIPQATSPDVADLRSPYAQALSEHDLYESSCPEASDVVLGKRPAVPLPLPQIQNSSRQSTKRQKFT